MEFTQRALGRIIDLLHREKVTYVAQLRETFATAPSELIGVVVALLLLRQPFGSTAFLRLIGLAGPSPTGECLSRC